MKIFAAMYDKTMAWSQHHFAPFWLCLVSFSEAIFFPIPPDVMLIPMSMSKPNKAIRYAIYTTIASLLGGVIGYSIGYFASDWVKELAQHLGYQHHFERAFEWFEHWGLAVIFLAGFISPIPFKVFTLCAGIMQMAFLPFFITASIGRVSRFLIVAKLAAWGGQRFADKLRRSIEVIGWAMIVLAVIAYLILK